MSRYARNPAANISASAVDQKLAAAMLASSIEVADDSETRDIHPANNVRPSI
jgi:hypothetical protein